MPSTPFPDCFQLHSSVFGRKSNRIKLIRGKVIIFKHMSLSNPNYRERLMILGDVQQNIVQAQYFALCPMISCLPSPAITRVCLNSFSFSIICFWFFFQCIETAGNNLSYNGTPPPLVNVQKKTYNFPRHLRHKNYFSNKPPIYCTHTCKT